MRVAVSRMLILSAVCGGIILATGIGLQRCQNAGWKSTLRGPYEGRVFSGEVIGPPTSKLSVDSEGAFEVYQVSGQIAPVLVWRVSTGHVQWKRLLLPTKVKEDGSSEEAGLRDLVLHRLIEKEAGYELEITCDWDWGGRERGLVDLDHDLLFRGLRLSW